MKNFLLKDQKWLSQEAIMAMTGLKRTTLYKLRMLHKIKWSKVGRKVFYLRESIDALMDSNMSEFNFKTKTNQ